MPHYPTDLSDSQWKVISKHLDTQRQRKYSLRSILNGIFYLVKSGCQWRMLPSDFAPWKLVYYYFSRWKRTGLIEVIHESLVEEVRKTQNKKGEPTAGVIDAQSVKNTLVSSESRGFDAGKKVKGIKRHIIVDTLGLVLSVVIQGASVQDRDGAGAVIRKMKESWHSVRKLFADGGYRGKLIDHVLTTFKIDLEIVKRTELHSFKVLPKRWIVERTFAWIDTNRRSAKNYERRNDTAEAIVLIAAIRIMINRF